ncbi:hypothetical protein ACFLQW_02415 [Candidatus Zixiibacteriota bacterium]
MEQKAMERGFPRERLANQSEPRIKKDERGYYLHTLSENIKIYFEEYYQFLELLAAKCHIEESRLDEQIADCDPRRSETLSYYRARKIIVKLILRTITSFYTDKTNLGVIMTPWCFGTVILEKIEIYRDRLSRGDVQDANIPDYPYDVVRYIDEIHKTALLEILEFPPEAFKMRWQYTELIRRYSTVLSNITSSLQSILLTVRSYGTQAQ